VVSLEDGQFATYDFTTGARSASFRAKHFRQADDDWIRTVNTEIQVPRVIRLIGLRPPAEADSEVQPPQYFWRAIITSASSGGKKFPTSGN